MNTNSTRCRIAAIAIAAITAPAFAACGAEISAPAQEIGRNQDRDSHRAVPAPERTTGNRWDFDDEYGKAKVPARKSQPAGSGTRNRMNFEDEWR
jgi:hypothetical protein